MEWLSLLIGGLGLGAILARVVEYFLAIRKSRTDRDYQEKREAYLGLLGAIHKAAIEPNDAHSKDFALWQARVDLFGTEEVAKAAQEFVDTNDGPREHRYRAFEKLINGMRCDLAK